MPRDITEDEYAFIMESNRIEGIHRKPFPQEIQEFLRFVQLDKITLKDVEKFVKVYQPDAQLRSTKGLNVRVGTYIAPAGGANIKASLKHLIATINTAKTVRITELSQLAFDCHVLYEKLHPFTDGNGRSGRIIWWWMMGGSRLGFLHRWYYQTLADKQKK